MTPEQLAAIRAGQAPIHRPRRTVPILLDGDLFEQIDAVQGELLRLEAQRQMAEQAAAAGGGPTRRINSPDTQRVESLRADLADLVAKAESSTMFVVVEGLNGTDWLQMMKDHPPKPNHEGKITTLYDADAIQKPLAKKCIIGHRVRNEVDAPILPLDDGTVDWLLDTVSANQLGAIAEAAYRCTVRDDAVPLDRVKAILSPTNASAVA